MHYQKIKSIKKINCNSKRYDITVEDNHNFFANNILMHNSGRTGDSNHRDYLFPKDSKRERVEIP